MTSAAAVAQGVWRSWDAPSWYVGTLATSKQWPREAAYTDERDGRHIFVEVQYRHHEAITHYGKRFPEARYWYVEAMAFHDSKRSHAFRASGSYSTYDQAMAAAEVYRSEAVQFLSER